MEHFFNGMYRVLEYPLVHFGETRLTLSMLLTVLLMLGTLVLSEMLLRRFLVMRLLGRTHLEPALQYAVGRIVGYGIMALGFYVAFQMAGINLSSLAVLAGAIGVGLGFGLQNIISNFISGLIVLAERPIAIGDRIEVGSVAGRVTKISLRSTTVLTNDNITIIVPNADFITQRVVNWTHSDPRVRFHISVGVAYGSDMDKVRRLMLEVAAEHPKVLKDPAPDVYLAAFGDHSLNLELIVWTAEMSYSPEPFRSELNFAIERKFRANKIEIPFPQRVLHLSGGHWPVPPAKAG